MPATLRNVFFLGLKEFTSLGHDLVLMLLIVYSMSVLVFVSARATGIEVRNASIAFVDEDGGALARRLVDAPAPPYFQAPVALAAQDVDAALDGGHHTFVVDIPPRFEADVHAGRQPALQLNVDATAMSQAGIGSGYLERIINDEIAAYLGPADAAPAAAATATVRVAFNPNLYAHWFLGVMMVVNMVTMLAIILTGSALIREREQGTLEHLLVMPLTPFEIMASKVWATALVIVVAAGLSLTVVVQGLLQVPIRGSVPLFLGATLVYLFAVTAIGIFLATVARSMPQLGLLGLPIVFPMVMLSGSITPLDSMPAAIRTLMQFSPSTHYVAVAQGVLFRGAEFALVWRQLALVALIGGVFFTVAALRLRRTLALAG